MTPVIAMPVSVSAPAATAAAAGGEATAFPELPVLAAMLRGARRLPEPGDWRSGVLAALAVPDMGDHNPALMAACAIPALQPGAGLCLALPVHVVAGMSRMFLGAPESFSLGAAQREELRLAFNAEFGSTDVRLHAVGSGWLLQAPFAVAANDDSPESMLGAALAREPASSAASRELRRLGAEVEMWLAALPFNVMREARGEPPINCIWFWSGATMSVMPAPLHMPGGLFTNVEADAWIAGLANYCGLPLRQVHAWQEVRDTPGAMVILQPRFPGSAMSLLPAWESAWLEPAWRDLSSRRLAALRLQIGRSIWQLPAPRMARWFRRAQPWWRMVRA